jgi:hypothetical protein
MNSTMAMTMAIAEKILTYNPMPFITSIIVVIPHMGGRFCFEKSKSNRTYLFIQ